MKAYTIVGVMGGSIATKQEKAAAFETGRFIAKAGAALLCGGGMGVMEAAAKGAIEHGGLTIGVLYGNSKTAANPYIQIPIVTNLGDARNAINVLTADLVVAIGGAGGTLSEIALALKNGKRVLGFQTCEPRFSKGTPEGFQNFERMEEFLDVLKREIENIER